MDTNVKSTAEAVWWLVLLRGIFMVLFGIIALVSPDIALLTLVFVFGFYAILDAASAIMIGVRSRGEPYRGGWSSRALCRHLPASSR